MPAYPAYPPVDPYAGYHAVGQPGTNPYLTQAKLPEMEMFSLAWSFSPENNRCLLHTNWGEGGLVQASVQAEQQRHEAQQAHQGQTGAQSGPAGVLPLQGKPQQASSHSIAYLVQNGHPSG